MVVNIVFGCHALSFWGLRPRLPPGYTPESCWKTSRFQTLVLLHPVAEFPKTSLVVAL